MNTILLVEDDTWLRDLYTKALGRLENSTVLTAGSAGESLKILDNESVDLIILDIFLDRHSGIELLHELASYNDTRLTPVIILSAVTENDFNMSRERWSEYGVVGYLYKPSTKPQDLIEAVGFQLSKNSPQERK